MWFLQSAPPHFGGGLRDSSQHASWLTADVGELHRRQRADFLSLRSVRAAGRNFYLSDLLYLGSALPDQGTALAGRNDQPQGDGWLSADGAVGH